MRQIFFMVYFQKLKSKIKSFFRVVVLHSKTLANFVPENIFYGKT